MAPTISHLRVGQGKYTASPIASYHDRRGSTATRRPVVLRPGEGRAYAMGRISATITRGIVVVEGTAWRARRQSQEPVAPPKPSNSVWSPDPGRCQFDDVVSV